GGPARLHLRWVAPLPSHELPVPAKGRLRSDDERRPPVPREELACRDEEHAVQGSERRSRSLAAQDAYLMAKDQDFQVPGTLVRAPADEPAREGLHDEGQEEEHRGMVEGIPWFRHYRTFRPPRAFAGRTRSRTSAWPWSASGGWDT